MEKVEDLSTNSKDAQGTKIDEKVTYTLMDNINYDTARRIEKEIRHDVMAHARAYGEQCPNAKPIIHLGATSC